MKLGDVIESSIWVTGEESPETRKRYEGDVIQAITDLCAEEGFEHGPVTFVEKLPSDDRVPEVPDHIQGQRVRLLVAEAEVFGKKLLTAEGSFIANLDKKDLQRLRTITRNACMQHTKATMTDAQCDEMIENYGPEAALDTLRKNVGVSVH